MRIRQATVEDFGVIAALAAKLNADPTTQCIHSGEGTEAIAKQMEIWHKSGELAYVVAEDESKQSAERFLATMGGEFDAELGRCWLWGPHNTLAEWEPVAAELFAAFRQILPESITTYDCYLNEQNQRALDFYRSLGFQTRLQAHVYVAPRPKEVQPVVDGCEGITAVTTPGLVALHNEVFPDTYISGQGIWEKVDEQHQVFVEIREGEVLGYIYAVLDDGDENLGYIEYVGVAEQARGQGIGEKLLRTALAWLFMEKGVREVGLNVDDTNTNARGLYEKVGFYLKYSGIDLRLKV
jgi:ribosomal protein S18 acetylase RimI-like enzyme